MTPRPSNIIPCDDFVLAESDIACVADTGTDLPLSPFRCREKRRRVIDQARIAEEMLVYQIPGLSRVVYIRIPAGKTLFASLIEVHQVPEAGEYVGCLLPKFSVPPIPRKTGTQLRISGIRRVQMVERFIREEPEKRAVGAAEALDASWIKELHNLDEELLWEIEESASHGEWL